MSNHQQTLQGRLDDINRHFRDRATEVITDQAALELLVDLHQKGSIHIELIDPARHALPLAKLTAANLCRIGVNVIWVTDAGNAFIKSLQDPDNSTPTAPGSKPDRNELPGEPSIPAPTPGELELHFRRKTAAALNDREAMLLLQYMHQHRLIEVNNFNYQHNGKSLAKLTAAHLCEIGANSVYITHRGDRLFQGYTTGPMRNRLEPLPQDNPMRPRLPENTA